MPLRSRRAWLFLAAILVGCASALAAALAGQVIAAAAAGTVSVILTLLATGNLKRADAFNPALVAAAFLVLLTCGRVAYVEERGAFGLRASDLTPLSGNEQAFALGVFAQLLAAVVFAAGVGLARIPRLRHRDEQASIDPVPLVLALLLTAIGTLASIGLLLSQTGGVAAYVDALGQRQYLFEDRGWLLLFPAVLPGIVLAWLAAYLPAAHTGNSRAVVVALVVLACVAAATAGSRSVFLALFVIPAVSIVHVRVRRVPLGLAIALAVLALLSTAIYRETLREGPMTSKRGGLAGLVIKTFASPDAHLPDPVAKLQLADPDLKLGATIAAAASAPVPRRLWPGKPTGANAQFTTLVDAERFEQNLTEYAVTLAGELLWNFSWPGLAGFAALGFAAGLAYRRALARPADPVAALVFAGALGLVLMLLRGDVYNSVIGVGRTFVPALAVLLLARGLAARA